MNKILELERKYSNRELNTSYNFKSRITPSYKIEA